jgi:RND family efflux transporter MFP subunit
MGICLVSAAITMTGLSCAEQQEETTAVERVVAVRAMVVQPADRQVTRTFTGSLAGERQAVLRARLAEAVQEVLVTEGQLVQADEVVLTLDRYGPSSRYAETFAMLQNAKKDFEKIEFLFGEGAVSEADFDDARTNYEVAQAQFESVSRTLEIHSPITGRVTSLNVSPGDLVRIGQELATVATTDRLRVRFGVNSDAIVFFEVGNEVVVSSESIEGEARGKVVTVAGSADPDSRAFQVEAIIDNADQRFSPGMFVHIDYVMDRLTGVIAVPRGTVFSLDDMPTVFSSVGGRAEMRRVTLGAELSGDVVISSGLNPGDTLITLGQDYLEDGLKLNITELLEQNR